jgi:hypothetical protein
MFCNKSIIFTITVLSMLMLTHLPVYAGSQSKTHGTAAGASVTGQAATFTPMPDPGKHVPIGNGYYLIYEFVKQPKLGTAILKIQVFTDKGNKDTSLAITVDSWMPSMPTMQGGHATCSISRKGDYLVPVDITMPGDWEIKLTIMKDDKAIYRGSYKFDV